MKAVFLCEKQDKIRQVYGKETLESLFATAGLTSTVYSKAEVLENPSHFADTELVFSTWGMPAFSAEEIKRCFPVLRAVFYAAGSVQSFARPFLECGVQVFSAWAANAVPVAEYTVAQILLSNKGFFTQSRLMKQGDLAATKNLKEKYHGNYGERVGLIGVGMIGSLVAKMLREYQLEVVAYDPFLSDARAKELGVTRVSLQELFSTGFTVSNHLANNAQTRGMLNGDLFARMRPYATFLNTGRGAQVVEADLVQVLTDRPDLTAVLDVTYPEPPAPGHPFYTLPNCVLTPHIAGSLANETQRMAAYMEEEYQRYRKGEICRYGVTLSMLETMA
ncbi:MAG: hydroxyacid dehydrogenase [Clostridia bacterium]|nr:hydroxyacid dehydrogenase [Clostridia bacterium]